MKKVSILLCLLLAAVVCASGCGKEKRCVVSGAVTTDGQPVPSGVVNFTPLEADPTKGVVGASADILDGQYVVSETQALLPGKYKVVVNSVALRDKKTGEFVDPMDVKDGLVNPLSCEDVDLVPPKFGAESEQILEVGNAKKMTYDIIMTNE